MPHPQYTINCDLGEGIPNEVSIIPLIDLASVACGGHCGNRDSISVTLKAVKEFGKKAGAHPSFPDRENFGRKSLTMQPKELLESLKAQILLFLEVAEEEKVEIDHIKFHGALYNDAAENENLANILTDFLHKEFPKIILFVPPHSELEKASIRKGIPIKLEVFGDRAYLDNFKLVSRTLEKSLFSQPNQVISQLDSIINQKMIRTYSGGSIPIQADTICFHGDNPGIMEFLPLIRNQFWK